MGAQLAEGGGMEAKVNEQGEEKGKARLDGGNSLSLCGFNCGVWLDGCERLGPLTIQCG